MTENSATSACQRSRNKYGLNCLIPVPVPREVQNASTTRIDPPGDLNDLTVRCYFEPAGALAIQGVHLRNQVLNLPGNEKRKVLFKLPSSSYHARCRSTNTLLVTAWTHWAATRECHSAFFSFSRNSSEGSVVAVHHRHSPTLEDGSFHGNQSSYSLGSFFDFSIPRLCQFILPLVVF